MGCLLPILAEGAHVLCQNSAFQMTSAPFDATLATPVVTSDFACQPA